MTRTDEPAHAGSNRATFVAWALLFLFAGIQLAATGHRYAHSAGNVGETCAVCLQFDRLEHAVGAADGLQRGAENPGFGPLVGPSASSIVAGRCYAARAPPGRIG